MMKQLGLICGNLFILSQLVISFCRGTEMGNLCAISGFFSFIGLRKPVQISCNIY